MFTLLRKSRRYILQRLREDRKSQRLEDPPKAHLLAEPLEYGGKTAAFRITTAAQRGRVRRFVRPQQQ